MKLNSHTSVTVCGLKTPLLSFFFLKKHVRGFTFDCWNCWKCCANSLRLCVQQLGLNCSSFLLSQCTMASVYNLTKSPTMIFFNVIILTLGSLVHSFSTRIICKMRKIQMAFPPTLSSFYRPLKSDSKTTLFLRWLNMNMRCSVCASQKVRPVDSLAQWWAWRPGAGAETRWWEQQGSEFGP